MVKPVLFAACDTQYRKLYAASFLNSASAQGHTAQVYCDGGTATMERRPYYSTLRFRMLPELLKTNQAVLALDIDSIIREPIEIGPEYDLGVFPRLDEAEEYKRILGGIFYCTDRAMEFAHALADGMNGDGLQWGDDQRILWQTYEAMKGRYRIKKFTTRFMDWDTPTRARIFTAKGLQKIDRPFMSEVEKWRQQAA